MLPKVYCVVAVDENLLMHSPSSNILLLHRVLILKVVIVVFVLVQILSGLFSSLRKVDRLAACAPAVIDDVVGANLFHIICIFLLYMLD